MLASQISDQVKAPTILNQDKSDQKLMLQDSYLFPKIASQKLNLKNLKKSNSSSNSSSLISSTPKNNKQKLSFTLRRSKSKQKNGISQTPRLMPRQIMKSSKNKYNIKKAFTLIMPPTPEFKKKNLTPKHSHLTPKNMTDTARLSTHETQSRFQEVKINEENESLMSDVIDAKSSVSELDISTNSYLARREISKLHREIENKLRRKKINLKKIKNKSILTSRSSHYSTYSYKNDKYGMRMIDKTKKKLFKRGIEMEADYHKIQHK